MEDFSELEDNDMFHGEIHRLKRDIEVRRFSAMSSESLALIQRSCPLIEELNLGVPREEPEVRLLICHPLNRV